MFFTATKVFKSYTEISEIYHNAFAQLHLDKNLQTYLDGLQASHGYVTKMPAAEDQGHRGPCNLQRKKKFATPEQKAAAVDASEHLP